MQFSEMAFHSLAAAFFPIKNCCDGMAKIDRTTNALIAAFSSKVARASKMTYVNSTALPSSTVAK